MRGQVPLGDEVRSRIRFGLEQLRVLNRHHEFEERCREFATTRLGGHFVPATGPVSTGGDQGRDFESYLRVSDEPGTRRVVGICTTQQKRLPQKIRADLAKIAGTANLVYVFLTADLPVSQVHVLQAEAAEHGVELEVFDGNRLAALLATSDLAGMAYRRLRLDLRDLPTAVRSGDEYLVALRAIGLRHGWPYADEVAAGKDFYQPQLLVGPEGKAGPGRRRWQPASISSSPAHRALASRPCSATSPRPWPTTGSTANRSGGTQCCCTPVTSLRRDRSSTLCTRAPPPPWVRVCTDDSTPISSPGHWRLLTG